MTRWTYITGAYAEAVGLRPFPIRLPRDNQVRIIKDEDLPFGTYYFISYWEAIELEGFMYAKDGRSWTLWDVWWANQQVCKMMCNTNKVDNGKET